MKKNLMFLALAAIGLASCNGGFKDIPGGTQYNILDDKSGASIKVGDFVSLNYVTKNDADSVMGSSYTMGHPAMQMMPQSQAKGDIFSALLLLSEGDSAVVKLNIDSLTKGQPRPPALKGKYLIYQLKIEKVIAKGNLNEEVFQGRIQAYVKTQTDRLQKDEITKVSKYIADKKLAVTKTASGLNYVVTQQGTGPNPAVGDTVEVNYVGRTFDGKVFDTSDKNEAIKAKLQIDPMRQLKPIKFPVGVHAQIIPGWDEAFQLLNKGSKAKLIIPSSLAYGERGNPPVIQPFTPLEFDVELVNIIKPNPNAPQPAATMVPQQPVRR